MVGAGGGGRLPKSSKHYGLTALCPIKLGTAPGRNSSYEAVVRETLAGLDSHERSPMARVPNTYLARLYILKDVFYEGRSQQEHLKSQYLFFGSDFHGELEPYLRGMWENIEPEVRLIWQHCVAFGSSVNSAESFVDYIKKCQVSNTFLFNGSNDRPLAEQLKGLYLKQEFGDFVASHQGASDDELRSAFLSFAERVQVTKLDGPTWRPGAQTLESARTHS